MPSRHQAPIQTLPRTSCSSGNLSVPGISMSPISHRMVPGRNSRESGTSAGLWKDVPFSTCGMPRAVHFVLRQISTNTVLPCASSIQPSRHGAPHGSGQYVTSCYPSSRDRLGMRSSLKAVSRQAAERAGSSHKLPQQVSIGVTWNPATMEPPGRKCRRWSHIERRYRNAGNIARTPPYHLMAGEVLPDTGSGMGCTNETKGYLHSCKGDKSLVFSPQSLKPCITQER